VIAEIKKGGTKSKKQGFFFNGGGTTEERTRPNNGKKGNKSRNPGTGQAPPLPNQYPPFFGSP